MTAADSVPKIIADLADALTDGQCHRGARESAARFVARIVIITIETWEADPSPAGLARLRAAVEADPQPAGSGEFRGITFCETCRPCEGHRS